MRISARFCQLCLHDEERLRLAVGEYFSGTRWWDVCGKHLREVQGHDMDTRKFEHIGDVDLATVNY